MQTHNLCIQWDICEESAHTYTLSVLEVLRIPTPVAVKVETPTWKETFIIE